MKKRRVFIIEDEQDIAHLVRFNLDQAGFSTQIASEGRHVLTAIRLFKPDLILLDLMLPDVDGLEICRRLKREPELQHIPVLMVTAKGSEADRIVGLELGADDYIVKPFSPRELVLRVRAVISRVYPEKPETEVTVLKKGSISLDTERHAVFVGEESVELTATEFRLLKELMFNAGKVQTRDALLHKVWDYAFEGYARTVDTHVRRLRKKLGAAGDSIETIRGVGYRFQDEAP